MAHGVSSHSWNMVYQNIFVITEGDTEKSGTNPLYTYTSLITTSWQETTDALTLRSGIWLNGQPWLITPWLWVSMVAYHASDPPKGEQEPNGLIAIERESDSGLPSNKRAKTAIAARLRGVSLVLTILQLTTHLPTD